MFFFQSLKRILRTMNPMSNNEDNALIQVDVGNNELVGQTDPNVLATVMKSGDWLNRIQLMSSKSGLVESGDFPVNHYAMVVGKKHVDIGEQVDVLVVAERPMAMDTSGDSIIVSYHMKLDEDNQPTGEFLRIMEQAGVKDSGCMYGIEYLLWLPVQKHFVTFFMGTKSARREAPNLSARMHKAATLDSTTVKNKKWVWRAPQIIPCTAAFDLPEAKDIQLQAKKFLDPKVEEIERVEEEGGGGEASEGRAR